MKIQLMRFGSVPYESISEVEWPTCPKKEEIIWYGGKYVVMNIIHYFDSAKIEVFIMKIR